MIGNLTLAFVVYGLRFQLQMMLAELERHAPWQDEAISHSERLLWSRARGALRAASTHLENLADDRNEGEGRNVKELFANRKLKRVP